MKSKPSAIFQFSALDKWPAITSTKQQAVDSIHDHRVLSCTFLLSLQNNSSFIHYTHELLFTHTTNTPSTQWESSSGCGVDSPHAAFLSFTVHICPSDMEKIILNSTKVTALILAWKTGYLIRNTTGEFIS